MISMAIAMAFLLQEEPPKDIYEEISRRNVFSPRIEKPQPKNDGTSSAPPPPHKRAFRVNGLWWDPKDKMYCAYLTDVEWDEGKTVKAGDSWYGATIEAVEKDAVRVKIDGASSALTLGGEFGMIAERAGAPPKHTETAKPADASTAQKPPEDGSKPKEGGKGLLDWFRSRKKP